MTSRHVRVVDPHELDTLEGQTFECFKIGLPVVALGQVVVVDDSFGYLADRCISRVARIGHKHAVARIDKCQGSVQYAFFRPYERLNLAIRVQVDIEILLVPLGVGRSQSRYSHIRLIPMCLGLESLATQGVDNSGVGWSVGTAYSQRNDTSTLRIEAGDLFELDREVILFYLLHAMCWHYIIVNRILHILLKF